MADSKAISPEVKGLLEKVRTQAKEYSDAFEYFEKQKTEFENIMIQISISESDFKNFLTNFKTEIELVKKKNVDYITKGIDRLETEVLKNMRKYDELSDIAKLREELIILKSNLTIELQNLKNTSNDFSSKIIFEIDSIFNKYRIEFENKINDKIRELDSKVNSNIENLELKLNMIDKFARMNKIQSESDLNSLKEELNNVNRKTNTNLDSLNNYVDKIRDETRVFEKTVNLKVDNFEHILHETDLSEISNSANKKLLKDLVTYVKMDNALDDLSQTLQKQLNTLDSYVDDLSEQILKNKSKMNLAIFISICSVVGLIIIFYLAFANIL